MLQYLTEEDVRILHARLEDSFSKVEVVELTFTDNKGNSIVRGLTLKNIFGLFADQQAGIVHKGIQADILTEQVLTGAPNSSVEGIAGTADFIIKLKIHGVEYALILDWKTDSATSLDSLDSVMTSSFRFLTGAEF